MEGVYPESVKSPHCQINKNGLATIIATRIALAETRMFFTAWGFVMAPSLAWDLI